MLIGDEVVLYSEGVLSRREDPVRPKGGRPEGAVGDVRLEGVLCDSSEFLKGTLGLVTDGSAGGAVPNDVLHVFYDLVPSAVGVPLAVGGANGAIGVASGGGMQPLLGHEGSSNHNLPGAEFPPSKLGTKELLDDGVVGFEFGVLSRGGAVQEGAGMFMVDFTVDVGEIAPILLGSFLAISASDFKAFGDGVSRGSAQVVR